VARLVFLGRLEDIAGAPDREVPGGALAEVLADLDPALAVALLDERIRLALNGTLLVDRAVTLAEDDELAFLPPVSGG
jgi:molybdopterin synthase sulfur carrier subunit